MIVYTHARENTTGCKAWCKEKFPASRKAAKRGEEMILQRQPAEGRGPVSGALVARAKRAPAGDSRSLQETVCSGIRSIGKPSAQAAGRSASLFSSAVSRTHIFSTVGTSTRSEGEWACSMVGPSEIMSSPGIFSANTAHSRPA